MRILFLSPLPPPTYGSALSSQFCLEVLQSSVKYDIKNIKLNYSEKFDDVGHFSLKKLYGFLIVFGKIFSILIRFKPDLVYIMPSTSGFAFIRDFMFSALLKIFGQNIIYHLRTQITEKDRNNKIKNYILKMSFKNTKVIVLGKELVKDIVAYFQKEDIFILPNAIIKTLSDKEFNEIERSRNNTSHLRLVFLSNMMKEKGWLKALEAAVILKEMKVEFMITFAGSWPSSIEKEEFNQFLAQYKLSGIVEYVGYVNKSQKHNLLAQSDILVFPTEYKFEALPRVIIEAMEFGIPQISTRNGAIASVIIPEETGFLLEKNSPEEIANYILALKNKQDLERMGRNSRDRFLSSYELAVFRQKIFQIIENTKH